MSFMSVVGGLASLASSTLDSIGASGWLGNSAAESLNKNTAQTNAALSFRESRKRALLEPSWNVAGLRAAGLNPILAASNLGNGSTAFNASGQTLNTSNPSISNPVTSALQASNLEKQNENLEAQNAVLEAEKGQVEANTKKALTEAELNSAKTYNTVQDTANKRNTRGLSGPYAAANQVGQDAETLSNRAWSWVKSDLSKSWNYFRNLGSRLSNSAKDYSSGMQKVSPSNSSGSQYFKDALYRH